MEEEELQSMLEYLDEVLGEYEKKVMNIGQNGLSASLLLNYRDEVQELLTELSRANVNMSSYWKRIVALDARLRGNAQRFVSEVGHSNFKQYQIINNPPKELWWWYLDKVTVPPPPEKKSWEFWK